jgi:hypothetical protein
VSSRYGLIERISSKQPEIAPPSLNPSLAPAGFIRNADQTRAQQEGRAMKQILMSTGNVFASLVLGALAFGFVFIKFPGAMEQILNMAAGLKLWLTSRGVSPEYNNWMRVLLEERQLVFMGFTIVTRVLMVSLVALVSWILNR